VPDWYIKKVSQYFQDDGMTSQYMLYQILNSVIIDKLQDTQSVNMSMSGTFSDVMSESKSPHVMPHRKRLPLHGQAKLGAEAD